ncbi:MAG: hypothetical protein CL748_04220 [Chloroflexi bacterium]|nr:hypothetical protein [Chloroflexota bacterium]
MKKNKYSLIALDIDGTMVGDSKKLSQRLKKAIKKVQEKGGIVSIATGRPFSSAKKISLMAGCNGPLICFQGAMTYDLTQEKILRYLKLDNKIVGKTLDYFIQKQIEVMLFYDDTICSNNLSGWSKNYAKRNEIKLLESKDLNSYKGTSPVAIIGVSEPEIVANLVYDLKLSLKDNALVTHSLPMLCEIEHLNAGKDKALQELLKRYKIDKSNVIAVGDGKGDQSMIAWAGLGVGIKNGHKDVINSSDMLIPPPEEEGLSTFLEKLIENDLSL